MKHKKWQTIQCYDCGGYGVVSVYSYCDFEGAGECNVCDGSGQLWMSKKGRLARWPGGPFMGSVSEKELKYLKSKYKNKR
jgi:RecJ-like exonuclease